MAHLKRTLNLFDTVSLVIGAIIGAGIFVITGVASQVAGPALVISVIIAGFLAFLTSMSITELVSAFPKEGGEYEYGYKTLSPLGGFTAGWLWTLNKIVAGSVLALGFATYLSIFLHLPVHAIAVIIIALATWINYSGVRKAGTVIDFFVLAKLSILIIFILLGIQYIKPTNFSPFAPFGINGILQAAGIIFFAYVGFARPVYLVEEIKNPRKNVPKGIFIGLAISTIIYILVTTIAIGLVGSNILGQTDSPLATAITSTGVAWAPTLIIIGALLATFSVLLDDNLGLSRMIFAMGRKGDYPRWFGRVDEKSRVPRRAIIFTGAIAAIITLFLDLRNLVQVASFFILIYFTLVNLSAIRLKRRMRKFPVVVSILGMVGTLSLAFSLSFASILISLVLIFLGAIYYHLKHAGNLSNILKKRHA